MAPSTLLVKVSNPSTKPRDLYKSNGSHTHIPDGAHVIVNGYLDEKIDTIIQINPDDIRRYLLKYVKTEKSLHNILINDTLGRNNKVEDTAIWTKNEEEDVDIEICNDTINISAYAKNLRVYQSSGEPSKRYYKTVVASHKTDGGIEVKGVDPTVAGDEGGPSKE